MIIIYIYNYHIEYYSQICKYRRIKDFTRWILSDKFIAKQYAKVNNFNIPETYQLVKYPHNINFNKLPSSYVIKPTDLCDSGGVYLIKNNVNLKTNLPITNREIVHNLIKLRAKIGNEYYMHDLMYDGKIPFKGYIVEELLLDNNDIPNDLKFYTFNGKIYFIAITFNRNKNNTFNSVWVNRNWETINIPMIKNNYYNIKIKKPDNYNELILKVESMSKILNRHCRIDVYNINNKIYLGEFTFFCGAYLHTFFCNFILGIIWIFNPDNYKITDNKLFELIPDFYNI